MNPVPISGVRATIFGALLLSVPDMSARAQGAFKPIMDFLGKVESVSAFGGPSFSWEATV
jgi:hypothetical protein